MNPKYMKIEIDYFYGCAIHKCNDKVKGDVRRALECVTNNIKK